MTIILFLVDTSASMCQKAYVNSVQKTYLDIAKGAVETFLKYRQRTQDCLGDRYMLLTFEEPPSNVKAGWKENHATFMNELKNLQSNGLTSMGESLRNAFDLLNLNRMQSGIDTYGQGRCPFYLEPSVIIVITDGGRYSYRNGVHQEIILPLSTQVPGTKFTKEPFRWDQRLFSLVLRMSGNKMDERVEGKVPHDDSPIERMCEVTGGRSYRVRSHYVLNQCIESLVQKVQAGVVLQFEPLAPKEPIEPDIVFQPTKKMIYVQKHISQKTFPIGYWPLPEPYWPDPKAVSLPPRDAHPKLKIITASVEEPQLVRSFPVDKYEVEASPLTLQILNKREMNKCWQVLVSNGMHGFECPFGYLKAAPNFTQVHLYVLAYNYPALLPLLNDLIHKYNMNPPNDLMYKFNSYVRSIPPYYCPFLRKALVNVNVPYTLLQFLLPDNVDNYLSPTVANQLKHIKNTAKQDQENLCMKVYKQLKQPKPPYRQVETAKLNTGALLRRDLVRNPLLRDTFTKLHAEIEPVDNYTIVVPQLTRQASAKTYRNPFDIPRRDMVEEIARMREAFLRAAPTSLVAKDSGHCLPISEMGNYQEYLKNKDNPLREIEPTNVRQHMFGNPYKKDKHMVMVDEADLSDVAPMKTGNGVGGVPGTVSGVGVSSVLLGGPKKIDASRSRKRKAGPLPRNFEYRRLSVDLRSPNSASSSSSRSNYDEDSSNSDTSSVCSGDTSDESDLDRIGFDFNEEENSEQDTALNGYVHNFINGISDESNMDSENSNTSTSTSTLPTSASAAAPAVVVPGVNSAPTAVANSHQVNHDGVATSPSSTNCHHYVIFNGMTHPLGYGGYTPHNASTVEDRNNPGVTSSGIMGKSAPGICNGFFNHTTTSSYHPLSASTPSAAGTTTTPSLAASASSALSTSPLSSSSVIATPSAAPSSASSSSSVSSSTALTSLSSASTSANTTLHSPYYSHSDINDASEISRILQQCHNTNGSGSSVVSASSLSISSVLNGNSSSNSSSSHSDNGGDTKSNDMERSTTSNSVGCGNGSSASSSTMLSLSNCFDSLKRETTNSNSTNSHHHPHLHWGSNSIQHQQQLTVASTTSSTINTANSNTNTNANHSHTHLQTNYTNNHVNHSNSSNSSSGNSNNSNSNSSCNNGASNHHAHASNNLHSGLQQQQQQQQQQPLPNKVSKASEVIPLTEEQRDAARKHNMDLRMQIFRDIRRPGRNYSQLLENLSLMKGDHEIMSDFIKMCINESMRFRRRQMVASIKDWWDNKQQQQQQLKSLPPSPQQQDEPAVKS